MSSTRINSEKLKCGGYKCFLCGDQVGTDEKDNYVITAHKRIIFYHSDCFEKEYGKAQNNVSVV